MMTERTTVQRRRKTFFSSEGRTGGTRVARGRDRVFRFAAAAIVGVALATGGAESVHAAGPDTTAAITVDASRVAAPLALDSVSVVFADRHFSPSSAISAVAHYANANRAAVTSAKIGIADHKILFGLVVLLFAAMMGVVTLMWRRLVSAIDTSSRSTWGM